ncbi:hypothetical protein TSA6c_00820 [Azospirillum sp. TSA6c]|nr:hypothetical protein TSA6c_11975 [Azospirillum sp. TSA6c]PWC54034.1 hypothetical protein TSA6c_00820 [Azospirillum sp. TSA6c]
MPCIDFQQIVLIGKTQFLDVRALPPQIGNDAVYGVQHLDIHISHARCSPIANPLSFPTVFEDIEIGKRHGRLGPVAQILA